MKRAKHSVIMRRMIVEPLISWFDLLNPTRIGDVLTPVVGTYATEMPRIYRTRCRRRMFGYLGIKHTSSKLK